MRNKLYIYFKFNFLNQFSNFTNFLTQKNGQNLAKSARVLLLFKNLYAHNANIYASESYSSTLPL